MIRIRDGITYYALEDSEGYLIGLDRRNKPKRVRRLQDVFWMDSEKEATYVRNLHPDHDFKIRKTQIVESVSDEG